MRPLAATFLALAVAGTAIGAYFGFQPRYAGTVAFWGLAGGPALVLGVAAALIAWRDQLLREWLTPRWGDFTRGVVAAVLLAAAAWGFTHVVTPAGSSREAWLMSLYRQIGDPAHLARNQPRIAAAIVAVALSEEMIWRGMATQLLADRIGSRTAWIWAAVLYAVAYVPTAWSLRTEAGGLDPILPLGALAGGLLWGGMARGFGRLAPGILAHALFDWAVVMMFPLWMPHST